MVTPWGGPAGLSHRDHRPRLFQPALEWLQRARGVKEEPLSVFVLHFAARIVENLVDFPLDPLGRRFALGGL